MEKPDTVTINVRDYASTYIATAKELKVRASCTVGAEQAAHACGLKIYGEAFTLKKVTNQTFIAEALKSEPKKPGAWHTDLPDDEISVLARVESDEYPIMPAYHDAERGWVNSESRSVIVQPVLGWLDLHEAAAILDASKPTA